MMGKTREIPDRLVVVVALDPPAGKAIEHEHDPTGTDNWH
jgi:hypothetical protein